MPRPARITPNRHWHTTIPEELAARVDLLLYSEVDNGVPRGAIQELVVGLLRAFFEEKSLDLHTLLRDLPAGEHLIRGKIGTLSALLTWYNSHNHLSITKDPS